MLEKIELFQEIQMSISEIEGGQAVKHEQAKMTVLKRIRK